MEENCHLCDMFIPDDECQVDFCGESGGRKWEKKCTRRHLEMRLESVSVHGKAAHHRVGSTRSADEGLCATGNRQGPPTPTQQTQT